MSVILSSLSVINIYLMVAVSGLFLPIIPMSKSYGRKKPSRLLWGHRLSLADVPSPLIWQRIILIHCTHFYTWKKSCTAFGSWEKTTKPTLDLYSRCSSTLWCRISEASNQPLRIKLTTDIGPLTCRKRFWGRAVEIQQAKKSDII